MAALRHGDPVLGEELLALVFEQVHVSFRPPAARRKGAWRAASDRRETLSATRTPEPVPLPKHLDFVSLEVYGTLIDWETGIYEAFRKEAERDGFTIERDRLIPLFLETQAEIMAGSYELYAEVLRRTALRVAEELGWELEPVRSSFLPNSIPSWPPFRDTNALLERLRKKFHKDPPPDKVTTGIGLISNIDDKLLGATRRHLRTDFDLVVTAQQVRSYKPDPAHFKECKRRIGSKTKWVHIATGLETDVIPCVRLKIPVIWIDRKKEGWPAGQRGKPTEIVKDLRSAVKLLGAA
jgi:2-haloacid dehalogenase/putative hydrolase of the HAD superfamily